MFLLLLEGYKIEDTVKKHLRLDFTKYYDRLKAERLFLINKSFTSCSCQITYKANEEIKHLFLTLISNLVVVVKNLDAQLNNQVQN